MGFLDVKKYEPKTLHVFPNHFFLFIHFLLLLLPVFITIYFIKYKPIDINTGLDILLLIVIILSILFFQSILSKLIQSIRSYFLQKELKNEPLNLYVPKNTETNNYLAFNPKQLELRESHPDNKSTFLSMNENLFLLLNSVPYKKSKIIEPYYTMIICHKIFNNDMILWRYFITIFFLISIITSIYSFTIVLLIDTCILDIWIQVASFFISLSFLFAYMLYFFIKNISIPECSPKQIMHTIKQDTLANTIHDEEDLDIIFTIYNNKKFFSQKNALEDIKNINDNISEKLKNIFQISAPIFYLANITIGLLYLTKINQG